jgi:hypothetical protein
MRVFLVAVLSLGAAGQLSAQTQTQCSVLGQNTFVQNTMQEMYLWYAELPNLDPALYDSPESYVAALRYEPLDRGFSYVSSAAATTAYYSSSEFIGIGFSMKQVGERNIRVTQVFPDSPASEAGLFRGDYLTAVAGRSIEELLESGALNDALGPSEIGVTVELTWRTPDGETRSALVTKRPVTIPTVSQREIFDVDGLPVGYIHFRNFVEPSIPALDEAFAEFQARGVTDVVLDLRYNGGGLISVASHLGSLIGGARTNTQPFVELYHNDKNQHRNQTFRFSDLPRAIDLPRLVVIATRASASSSELVINGLKPFLPVTVVGDRTFGKPVGQYGFNFCDKVLFPVSFKNRNAAGEADYFDGLAVDCPAADNLDRPLGDPGEASLAEALYFLRRGRCSAESQSTLRALTAEAPDRLHRDGWSQMLNAW